MVELAHSDPLAPSTSSSGVGLREENSRGSNVTLVSSATLNERGMSLHSFAVESEVFMEKAQFCIETVLQDSFVRFSTNKRAMTIHSFLTEIPPVDKKNRFIITTFYYEIKPRKVELSNFSSDTTEIHSVEKDVRSLGANTIQRTSLFRITNAEVVTVTKSMDMSLETFHQEIPPKETYAESSENLKRLDEHIKSLQTVFDKVRVSRELNHSNDTNRAKDLGYLDIKLFLENASTQTQEASKPPTDLSWVKIESLILECEYARATANMMRRYPFYYDFLKRCYADRHFCREGELRHLRPKQKNLKRAIIHAYGCNRSYLEAIDSLLLETYNNQRNRSRF